MAKYARIEGGRIVNIAAGDADWAAAAPGTWVAASADWFVGAAYDADANDIVRETASEKRTRLSVEITNEQERRRSAATLSIPVSAETTLTQALDQRTLDYLTNFNRLWTEGRVEVSYTVQTDQAATTLTAGQVRLIALAADAYTADLPVKSAARHQALATTVDANLDAFDPTLDSAWPNLTLSVDLSAPPSAPSAALDARLAAIEARLTALEA